MEKPKIFKSKIKSIEKLNNSITEVVLDLKKKDFVFYPGQYVRLIIPSIEEKNPGDSTRDFTISSSPTNSHHLSFSISNSDTQFKKKIMSEVGLKVLIHGPFGIMYLPKDYRKSIVFIAGGTGVTPALSMMRYIRDKKTSHKFTLIYSTDDPEEIIYRDELDKMNKDNPNLDVVYNIGEIKTKYIKKEVDFENNSLWYICGSPEMVKSTMDNIIDDFGVNHENIRIVEYTGLYKKDLQYHIGSPVNKEIEELKKDDIINNKHIIKAVLEVVGINAAITITDRQGSIVYVNDRNLEISKYSREELIGQNPRINKSGHHPPEMYKDLWDTITSGKTWNGDIKNKAKDGSFYWDNASISPIFNSKGDITHFIAIRIPITDKKNLEEKSTLLEDQQKAIINILEDVEEEKEKALQEQERLNTMLYSIGDGVIVTNSNGEIIIFNKGASEITGFEIDDVEGKKYTEVLKFTNDKDKKYLNNFISESISGGDTIRLPLYSNIKGAKKGKIPVSANASSLKNSMGKIIGCVIVFKDISKEMAIDKSKSEFVSLASHQLRTPLSAINWYSEMLLAGDAGKINKEQKNFLQEIYTGNQRMIELVNSLLNVSRLELGTFIIEPELMDIKEVSSLAIKELKAMIKDKKITITEEYDDVPKVKLDNKLSNMIFQNLLSNAVKYSPVNSEIKVKISNDDKYINIDISDQGIGIPKKDIKKIFTKFFRSENAKSGDATGTGLGLYILKSIIENSEGKINFSSEEGKGTTFHVSIPLSGMKKKDGKISLT